MLIKQLLRRVATGWLIGLMFAGLLLLSACGGAAEETPEATQAPAQEEAAVAANTSETEEKPTEEASEDAPANPEEEIVSVPLEPATCEAVEVEENTKISPVSDTDWSKGPEDARVTVIEFGDFQ